MCNEELGLPVKPATPTMHIPWLASELDCSDRVRRRARTLAEEAKVAGMTTGVHPIGFATACLCKAGREAGHWLTPTDIADVANTSTATVRNHADTLEDQRLKRGQSVRD